LVLYFLEGQRRNVSQKGKGDTPEWENMTNIAAALASAAKTLNSTSDFAIFLNNPNHTPTSQPPFRNGAAQFPKASQRSLNLSAIRVWLNSEALRSGDEP
jgi:hypothetical protein